MIRGVVAWVLGGTGPCRARLGDTGMGQKVSRNEARRMWTRAIRSAPGQGQNQGLNSGRGFLETTHTKGTGNRVHGRGTDYC